MRLIALAAAALACLAAVAARADDAPAVPALSEDLRAAVLRHGPWPPPLEADPSNRVSGDPAAIALGEALFSEPRLSANAAISCATCHIADAGFTDGVPTAHGLEPGTRNTLALFNLRFQRWFGWDGSNDNLWAQSIRPILAADEMGLDAGGVRALVSTDAGLSASYRAVFGQDPAADDAEHVLVNVAKALAAYQETLVTGRTAFDRFRDAVAAGDRQAAAGYPADALRGLEIFLGKGKCTFCHSGPAFTNGEFHDAGVPYFIAPGIVDKGRIEGIAKLKASPYTLDGEHTDDAQKRGAWKVRHVKRQHRNFGEFRVPSLRNLKATAPYMHNGSLATLEAVVRHYSEIDTERLHADGERILRPLNLSDGEVADLVAFLETLSE